MATATNTQIEMRRLYSTQHSVDPSNRGHWLQVFNSMDRNGDGKISYKELKAKLKEFNKSLPNGVARQELRKNDTNDDGYLDFEEFMAMLQERETRALFYKSVDKYVGMIVPKRHRKLPIGDEGDNAYEEAYSCCPPPFGMMLFSLLEIIAFVYDAATRENDEIFSPATSFLIYNPHRRVEVWRFLTYMFVHNGILHLIVNLFVQIMLGIPLEMVHQWWRVGIIYLLGVIAGSLGTSISDPNVYLAGASGGVYAIMTAHVATIIMNWNEMTFAVAQLAIFLVIASVDVGSAVYNRYIAHSKESETIGYAAHLAGAIAGLLVGIWVLRNLEETSWEKKLWWAALVIFTALMTTAVVWNIGFPSYFPAQYV